MKILIILLSFLSLQLNCWSQEKLKQITVKHKNPYFTEKFQVKKDNRKIKQGKYQKIISKGRVQIEGQYEDNEKVGDWKFYNTWEGTLTQIYNYSRDEVIFDKELSNNSFDSTKYQRPILYLGGMSTLYRDWARVVRYPSEAKRVGKQGKVIIKAIINSKGEIENPEIVEGIGFGCDEEVLRSFKMLKGNWLPAIDKLGNPTESEIVFPFTFKLN